MSTARQTLIGIAAFATTMLTILSHAATSGATTFA